MDNREEYPKHREDADFSPDRYRLGQEDCGVALDIGATNVGLSIFRMRDGQRLVERQFSNPQQEHGADMIARLVKASNPVVAADLQGKLIEGIEQCLQEALQASGIGRTEIAGVGVVGNTAMLALLYNTGQRRFLDPDSWQEPWAFQAAGKTGLVTVLRQFCPVAGIEIIEPLMGFTGSGLLAGMVAARMPEQAPGTLLIDFGANTEIALWDGTTAWVTSVAGGPAFEGYGLSCGSAPLPGAIFRARRSESSQGLFEFETLEGKSPMGICGSGYVDILRLLLESNRLDNLGRLQGEPAADEKIELQAEPFIWITKQDIDTLQRAKAAVEAGLRNLLHQAEMWLPDIRRIYVAGHFGRLLDVASAQKIGLLPGVDAAGIELCGNIALKGCEDILRSRRAGEMLDQLRQAVKYGNLAFDTAVETDFFASVYLRPFE
ncbi:ASKHA domain-containing protein [Acetonema longum]|uniref:Ferredoxin n=1 Tax=Acetonema longum DSM 6540 TaxID=1009370 RepID=F7NGT9_9FIRM|nr:ASKHA domain-containing protein [Acetonema longum]EGO64670.1 ferredoxin [Acetonema longum DSM 6540]